MVRVEQLNLLSKIAFTLFVVLFLNSCAKNAPSLPKDYGSVESSEKLTEEDFDKEFLKLTCKDISLQLMKLDSINKKNINKINSTRVEDQATGYVASVLFPPLWFAIDKHSDTKDKIDEVYRQKDKLFKLQSYKKCDKNNS